jgi:hypothetical protein
LTASWPVIQQHVVGLGALLDPGELIHQLGIDVQAPSGVHDQRVTALGAGPTECPLGYLDRVAGGALLVDGRACLLAHPYELLHGGRAVHVAGR